MRAGEKESKKDRDRGIDRDRRRKRYRAQPTYTLYMGLHLFAYYIINHKGLGQ